MASNMPSPNVHYRIQNVDYLTFIELPKAHDDERLVLRPMKDTDKQQWCFEPTSDVGTYRIRNVSELKGLFLTAHISDSIVNVYSGNSYVSVTNDEHKATLWDVRFEKGSDSSTLTFKDPKDPKKKRFLNINESNTNRIAISGASGPQVNNDTVDDCFKWNIVKAWPDVPKGPYFIRNLGGRAMQMAREKKVSLDTHPQGKHQPWEIESRGNGGQYEIKNIAQSLFLNTGGSPQVLEKVHGKETAAFWQLRSVGGFAYSIGLEVQDYNIPLALTFLEDENEIVLKPLRNERNQIWFFEQAVSHEAHRLDDDTRYPEVPDGTYILSNASMKRYIWPTANGVVNWDGAPDSDLPIHLAYVDGQSPVFSMKSVQANVFLRTLGDILGTGVERSAFQWVLDRCADPTNPGEYCYYISTSEDPRKVISGTLKENQRAFAMQDKKEGDATQMWRFIKN